MAGNARGKMKEHMEGIHRNYDWVIEHCNKMLALINDPEHKMHKAVIALGEATEQLDEVAQRIYATI